MSHFFKYDLDRTCRIGKIVKQNKKTFKVKFDDFNEKNYNSQKLKLVDDVRKSCN